MASIVIELQKEALNGAISLTDLLRKALVVARKLKIREFEDWILKELEGYSHYSEIPDYRELVGVVKGWNPTGGWQPILFQTTKDEQKATKRKLGQRIAELESLLTSQPDINAGLKIPFSPEKQQIFCEAIGYRTEIILSITNASLAGVLDTVRNIILNWALKLEEDGVLGEEMTFTDSEKNEAGKHTYNVNNFYGPVTNPQIQQGSSESEQSFKVEGISMDNIAKFIETLRKELSNLKLEEDLNRELSLDMATIQAQVASPNPKGNIVRESLSSIRRILEGAGGGAAAQLLIQLQSLFSLN